MNKFILWAVMIGLVMGLGRPASAFEPYLQNGTDPQTQQYRLDDWVLTDWAPTPMHAQKMVKDFKKAGIYRTYMTTQPRYGTSTLIVGPGFYRLSGLDQRRFLMVFDQVYQATAQRSGTLFLRDSENRHVIGIYTAAGLQLY
jgi:hypothetical protein